MRYPNIEAERARRGISMDSLARQIGVSRKSIYNWFNKGDIPQSALEKMALFFNCSVEYLQKIE